MKPLPNKYNHREAEKKWQEYWEDNKIYQWDASQPRENTFVIDTPPPTVSGVLHMGHVFSYVQADFVARYQRMQGKTVFYPMGFDDNGLPTERLVEKVKKIRGSDMPRADFITICKEVVESAEEDFRRLFTSIALSVDWEQEYQTISERSRKISQSSFLDLFHKEQAYRTLEPTLWDPIDRTALAQADIIDQELPGMMNDILFTLEDGTDVTIATTRPELLPACVAVFCHPDDARYKDYVGKKAITPLFEVEVPVLTDEQVDMEKGTGLTMCCTFGDQTDIHWWKQHNLPTRVILDKAARLTHMEGIGNKDINGEDWPSKNPEQAQGFVAELQGLKAKAAKEKILELLNQEGKLVKQEEISHAVKCAERSGSPLEILVTPQWFIKIMDKKSLLLEKADECIWHPDHMRIRLDHWIEGLSWDWCISRQRYFGVPFPVWYSKRAGEEGKILVAHPEDLPVDPMVDLPRGYENDEVEADIDVMDTWATSSVSPQLSSHAITDEYALDSNRHAQLFPADLRPQAHEIIRTWAFYTLVKAVLHENTIPWKHLMISGWCLASDKTKMSKSKGNVITPVERIEEKGTDAVRFWSSTARLGSDTAFSEDVLKIGKKLVNKLWNAAKFAAIHLEHVQDPKTASEDVDSGIITETLDKWVLTRLHRTIVKATEAFEVFEYCRAREAIEDFFWNDFCDNYLEMSKKRAYSEDGGEAQEKRSAAHTVYHCLDGILRLFAPFVPHITEELYSHIFDEAFSEITSLHAPGTWPKAEHYPLDETAEHSGIAAVAILDVIRKMKAEKNVSLKWPLESVSISKGSDTGNKAHITACEKDLKNVMNAKTLIWDDTENQDASRTADGNYHVIALFSEESDSV